MTTFASTWSSPPRTVDDGPPGFWAVASSTIEIEKPPNGFELMVGIVARIPYPPGVSRKGPDLGDHLGADALERVEIRKLAHADDDVLRAGIGVVAEAFHDLSRRVRVAAAVPRDPDVLKGGAFDLVRVAADDGAVVGEDPVLAGDAFRRAEDVGRVGVASHETQGLLFAAAPDHDRHPGA